MRYISREGGLQEMEGTTLGGGVEPSWSRNASKRSRAREQSHIIVYRAKCHLVGRVIRMMMWILLRSSWRSYSVASKRTPGRYEADEAENPLTSISPDQL